MSSFQKRARLGAMRRKENHLSPVQKAEVKSQVKRLINNNAETYQYDNTVASVSVSTTATIQAGISTPAQGVQDGQRTGDMVELKRLHFNYSFIGADATNVIRVILFRWYENNGSNPPTAAQVLQSVASVESDINHDSLRERKLFVFYDKKHYTSLNGPNAGGKMLSFTQRQLGRKDIAFDNAAITGEGLIYALFTSDSLAATHPSLGWYSRLEYKDA